MRKRSRSTAEAALRTCAIRAARPPGATDVLKYSASRSSSWSMRSSIERRAQDRLAARELTLHGVDGDAADGGELAVREAVHVVQGEEDACLARHRLERAAHVDPRADGRRGRRRRDAGVAHVR